MIIHGDCLEEMKKMDDNSISAIVTDPPYGLSFMNKKWDDGIPHADIWAQALRICKPGSFLLAFGGTRTFHRLTCTIEDAGWQIRDCIMWLYGSGFPKSHNHFGIQGYGTALKSSWEPIIMAMKPCDGTFKHNAKKWEQAGINIDDCRIGTGNDKGIWPLTNRNVTGLYGGGFKVSEVRYTDKGRWPANLILDEEAGKMLDEQNGISKSSKSGYNFEKSNSASVPLPVNCIKSGIHFGESGGASRFFYCAKASSKERNEALEHLPLKRTEKTHFANARLNDQRMDHDQNRMSHQNTHPTIKPLKLMEYLIKLIMPPKDGILLDPFAGSGTTILAAKNLGFNAIGIEENEEYCKIANARIQYESDRKIPDNKDKTDCKS